MQEFVFVTGMILRAEPIGEYDRRLVILTKEKGKISAFAKGARRSTNKLVGSTDMFCFGEFKLYPGKESYSVVDIKVKNYFEELRSDLNGAMYGMYFLEVLEYNTRENNDEADLLKLLYQSLRAITSEVFDNKLVKAIFEIKTMSLMGEYKREEPDGYLDSTLYTIDYIISTKPEKLYSFAVSDKVLAELRRMSEKARKLLWNHDFKSEEMLKIVEN